MPQPRIKFIKGQGGLQRPLPGQDFISGLVFYTASLPSGFSSSNRIKTFFQPQDAIAAGILNDYSDATAATGEYLITNDGAVGDTINLSVNDLDNDGNKQLTVLCLYKRVTADSTIALLGASIAAAINAGTLTHGYSATFATATLSLTAPKRMGIYLNSGAPIVATIVGAIAGTITQFASGTFSPLAFYYYHIEEFFRIQPGGNLYVGFFAVPGTYDFSEINTIQNFSNGTIRQVGVYKDFASTYAEGDHTLVSNACVVSDNLHKPLSGIYAADMSAINDITTLPDLNLLNANKSMSCIGQDAGGTGYFLWLTGGKSVTVLGAQLGTAALAKVSEDIAWVGKFDISDGSECEILGFANGQLFSSAAISDTLLDALNDRRYVFLKKFVGQAGSYFNDSHCAVSVSSDYAYLENNRTIDKAIRGIYVSLLPSLNGPLVLLANGNLSETTTAYLESQAGVNLAQMVRDGELGDYGITINPAQNVLSTSTIIISVELLINGVARQIQIPIGFTPKIS